MSSRARAILFALGALCCAGISAALAGGAATRSAEGLDELRPVVVTTAAFHKGQEIERGDLDGALEERRVPVAFAPPDVLAVAADGLGRRLAKPLPPGSYITASDFTAADRPSASRGAPNGTTPVEITVTGAGALAGSRSGPGTRVDVVVSGEPGPGPAAGRTYVAARRVALLDLVKARAETGVPGERWVATLALGRAEALKLIRAEGVARSIRLLGR